MDLIIDSKQKVLLSVQQIGKKGQQRVKTKIL